MSPIARQLHRRLRPRPLRCLALVLLLGAAASCTTQDFIVDDGATSSGPVPPSSSTSTITLDDGPCATEGCDTGPTPPPCTPVAAVMSR